MTDSTWASDAAAAISLCQTWVRSTATQLPGATWWLFGSLILDRGNSFDPHQSDIDLLCVLPEPDSAASRLAALETLQKFKADLELQIIPCLRRPACNEPAASLVVATTFEIQANIHKSAARSFFTKNVFFNLDDDSLAMVLPGAGEKAVPDEVRQAAEYTQGIRNKFLAICANRDGGLPDFTGTATLPKALCRSAAQLNERAAEGEWYDVGLGLDLMMAALRDAAASTTEFRLLHGRLLKRVGGRAARGPLGASDQLLLAELLFDIARKSARLEDIATCSIFLGGSGAQRAVAAIHRLAPSAHVVRNGPSLNLRASASDIGELRRLARLDVLAPVLNVKVAHFHDASSPEPESSLSTQASICKLIAKWSPDPALRTDALALERDFGTFMSNSLLESDTFDDVRLVASLRGGIDFGLVKADSDRDLAFPLGVELVAIRSRNGFFSRLGALLDLSRRYAAEVTGDQATLWPFREIILVVFADQQLLDDLAPDVARISETTPEIRIVQIAANGSTPRRT